MTDPMRRNEWASPSMGCTRQVGGTATDEQEHAARLALAGAAARRGGGVMDEERRDQLLAELIEKPAERSRILRDTGLGDRDREDILTLVEIADLLWLSTHGAPPLEDDRVAMMLGIGPDRRSDGVPGDE